MKKLLSLFVLAIALTISAFAQPTITNVLYSTIGDKVVSNLCDTTGVAIPTGGSAQLWDYSNLTVQSTSTQEAVAPDGIPNIDKFPDANIVLKSDTGSTVYNISADKMTRLGITSNSVVEVLTNPEIDFVVPFTMGSTSSDDYAGTITAGGNVLNRSGSLNNEGIGWGTVKTPKGTFDNVLLVNQKNQIVDELTISGFTTKVTTDLDVYTFLKEGEHTPVLVISVVTAKTEVSGNVVSTTHAKTVAYSDITVDIPVLDPPLIVFPADEAVNITQPVTLQWKELQSGIKSGGLNSDDVTYTVQVSKTDDFAEFAFNNETTDTFALVAGLDFSTKYYWRVRSTSNDASSDWTTVSSFTTAEATVAKAELVSPIDQAINIAIKPEFKWMAVDGADSYNLQISDNADFTGTPDQVTDITDTTYVASSDLDYNTRYYWRVQANKGGLIGEWSDARSFKTMNVGVEVPELAEPADNASGVAPSEVTLRWMSQGAGIQYNLQVATDENFESLEFDLQNLDDTLRVITDLTPEITYYWRIAATNGNTTSAWSSSRQFTTGPLGVSDWVLNPETMNIALAPMPAVASLRMTYNNPAAGEVNYKIFDASGKILMIESEGFIQQGQTSVIFNIQGLAPGSYFISIDGKDFKAVTKFVKE